MGIALKTYLFYLYLPMSVRVRNGKTYYRYTIWDKEAKKYRYLERRRPPEGSNRAFVKVPNQLTAKEVGKVFSRFREPSSAAVVLHLLYFYGIKPVDIYKLKISQVDFRKNTLADIPLRSDTVRLLRRHIDRIRTISDGYLIVDLRTGKKLSHYQLGYIVKVIRKEINPDFSLKSFKSHKKLPL